MGARETNVRLTAAVALVLFLMLWLPLGQLDFMIQHWMKVGTFAAPFLLLAYLAAAPKRPSLSDPVFMSLALLVAYIAHQFEEHWIDLYGNHYAFYDYVNALVRSVLNSGDNSVAPLTPQAIYVINTSLVWLVGVIAIVVARHRVFPVMALAAITLVNGITHILAGIVNVAYNPGLLTSVVVFVPLSVVVFRRLMRHEAAWIRPVIASLAWAVLAHILMVSGMLAANLYSVISEATYFVLLVIWSALPLALFRGTTRT
ncbi:MAG: HXXEE domain-containing protein [Pseudomonadota bacterium]